MWNYVINFEKQNQSPLCSHFYLGLFHRVILMSGSALSSWAFASHPEMTTRHVAQQLVCPITGNNDDLAECLRTVTVEEILNVYIPDTPYTTTFGPIVDKTVIPMPPAEAMEQFSRLFSK